MTKTGRTSQWRRSASSRAPIAVLNGNATRTEWPLLLSDYFCFIFKKASFEQTLWRQRLRDRIAERTAEFEKNPSLSIVFTVGDIQQAVSGLKRGRTTADDLVSAEMLQALNSEVFMALACIFLPELVGVSLSPRLGLISMPFASPRCLGSHSAHS